MLNDSIIFLFTNLAYLFLALFILRYIQSSITKAISGKSRILFYLFAMPGVVVHELSHLFFVVASPNNKVESFSLFRADLNSGKLGYVSHSYRKTYLSPFINMLIGMAPLLVGLILLNYINSKLPDYSSVVGIQSAFLYFIDNSNIAFWVTVYLSASIFTFMLPSKADFQGSSLGICLTFVALIALTLLKPTFIQPTAITEFLKECSTLSIPVIVFLIVILILFKVPSWIERMRKNQ